MIDTKIGLQRCFKLESFWPGYENMTFTDYVSLYSGLLKREIIADSIEIRTIENPNVVIGWLKFSTVTDIQSKNF